MDGALDVRVGEWYRARGQEKGVAAEGICAFVAVDADPGPILVPERHAGDRRRVAALIEVDTRCMSAERRSGGVDGAVRDRHVLGSRIAGRPVVPFAIEACMRPGDQEAIERV